MALACFEHVPGKKKKTNRKHQLLDEIVSVWPSHVTFVLVSPSMPVGFSLCSAYEINGFIKRKEFNLKI